MRNPKIASISHVRFMVILLQGPIVILLTEWCTQVNINVGDIRIWVGCYNEMHDGLCRASRHTHIS